MICLGKQETHALIKLMTACHTHFLLQSKTGSLITYEEGKRYKGKLLDYYDLSYVFDTLRLKLQGRKP